MKILIVKLSSIGDVVHTLPALAAIRRAQPDAEIYWVVERTSAAILRDNPLLTGLIEVDTKSLRRNRNPAKLVRGARRQLRTLRTSVFDIAIDFQGLLKSATIAKLSKARRRVGFDKANLREPAGRFLLTDRIKIDPRLHIIEKNLALAGDALRIPVSMNNLEFPIFTDAGHRLEAAEIVRQINGEFAILNPAGGWVTKLWPAEQFGALADRLWEEKGLTSIIATAPNEIRLAQKVLKNVRSGTAISAQPSLKGFYELARLASVYVGGDTAPTHLAVAAGTPVVGIYGPTEWWRNGSPNPADICVARTDISCRIDCSRRTCGKWICMDIETEQVLAAVLERMGQGGDLQEVRIDPKSK